MTPYIVIEAFPLRNGLSMQPCLEEDRFLDSHTQSFDLIATFLYGRLQIFLAKKCFYLDMSLPQQASREETHADTINMQGTYTDLNSPTFPMSSLTRSQHQESEAR